MRLGFELGPAPFGGRESVFGNLFLSCLSFFFGFSCSRIWWKSIKLRLLALMYNS